VSADRFVGAWRLLSLEAGTSTGNVRYPYGKDAAGYRDWNRSNRADTQARDGPGSDLRFKPRLARSTRQRPAPSRNQRRDGSRHLQTTGNSAAISPTPR
jgi:hypothetical protein